MQEAALGLAFDITGHGSGSASTSAKQNIPLTLAFYKKP